jgi:hypothetical protein
LLGNPYQSSIPFFFIKPSNKNDNRATNVCGPIILNESTTHPVTVREGDIIVMDVDGVICVPVELAVEAARLARKGIETDAKVARGLIEEGLGIVEAFKKYRTWFYFISFNAHSFKDALNSFLNDIDGLVFPAFSHWACPNPTTFLFDCKRGPFNSLTIAASKSTPISLHIHKNDRESDSTAFLSICVKLDTWCLSDLDEDASTVYESEGDMSV